jgi:hypothetical protein
MDWNWEGSWRDALLEDWLVKAHASPSDRRQITRKSVQLSAQFQNDFARRQHQFDCLRACNNSAEFEVLATAIAMELLRNGYQHFFNAVASRLCPPGSNWFDRILAQHGVYAHRAHNNLAEIVEMLWGSIVGKSKSKRSHLGRAAVVDTPAALHYFYQHHLKTICREWDMGKYMPPEWMIGEAKVSTHRRYVASLASRALAPTPTLGHSAGFCGALLRSVIGGVNGHPNVLPIQRS